MVWVSITHCLLSMTGPIKQKQKTWKVNNSSGLFSFPPSAFCQYGSNLAQRHCLTVLLTRLRHCLRGKPHSMCNETKVQIQTNTKYKYKYKTNTKYKVIYSLSDHTAAVLKRNPDCSMKWLSIPYIISYSQ